MLYALTQMRGGWMLHILLHILLVLCHVFYCTYLTGFMSLCTGHTRHNKQWQVSVSSSIPHRVVHAGGIPGRFVLFFFLFFYCPAVKIGVKPCRQTVLTKWCFWYVQDIPEWWRYFIWLMEWHCFSFNHYLNIC